MSEKKSRLKVFVRIWSRKVTFGVSWYSRSKAGSAALWPWFCPRPWPWTWKPCLGTTWPRSGCTSWPWWWPLSDLCCCCSFCCKICCLATLRCLSIEPSDRYPLHILSSALQSVRNVCSALVPGLGTKISIFLFVRSIFSVTIFIDLHLGISLSLLSLRYRNGSFLFPTPLTLPMAFREYLMKVRQLL